MGKGVRICESFRKKHIQSPNLMFVADLMFMTPEGAILGRPASTVRTGEERFVARRLAELGIAICRDLAISWPGRVPYAAVGALPERGDTVLFLS